VYKKPDEQYNFR